MSFFYKLSQPLPPTFAKSIGENIYTPRLDFMKRLVAFFEIPAADFSRAVKFYETALGVAMTAHDCGSEKMAFFPEEQGVFPGAISWSSEFSFTPSEQGVLVSLSCEDMNSTLSLVKANGGKIITPKTKIEAEGRGYFSIFIDSEGNRLSLYSDK